MFYADENLLLKIMKIMIHMYIYL